MPTSLHNQAARLSIGFAIIILLAIVSGCGKNDRELTTSERLKSVQQQQETKPDFFVPRKTVDYMADIKGIKDAPAPAPAPAKAEPAKPAPVETRAAPAASAPSPAPQPAAAAPQAAPVVASAAPTARPATPSPDAVIPVISIVSREQPEFPREAMRAGIESGSVRVKLTIAANGDVSNVAILAANPPRVFDRSVKASLARWKFNPGSEGRGYETEVAFALQK